MGGYWKVEGEKRKSYGSGFSYPVIKCTKYGKEFSGRNGFSDTHVDKLVAEGKTWKATDHTKVSKAGQQAGILKRKILHLEARIAADTAELNNTMAELTALIDKE